MHAMFQWMKRQSLAVQFLLTGGLVSIFAVIFIGMIVTSEIEYAVTQSSAATTALYVDSVIAPLLPDMRRSATLGDTVARALDETLGQGALGTRLASFKLWSRDGTILYAKDKSEIGLRFPPGDELTQAWKGKVVAQFNRLDELENAPERAQGKPLLEIYNPVLQPWSGEVVAVSEFYEVATELEKSLSAARLWSWLAVVAVVLVFFLSLSAIVFRGSATIESQKLALNDRVDQLSEALDQNRQLRLRIQRASQRHTALTESYLRRLGADLHDGPAQLVALAALRLDSEAMSNPSAPPSAREREVTAVRASLDDAMREIRSICTGLVLPNIETLDLTGILKLAVAEHRQRTDTAVALTMTSSAPSLTTPIKICIYRFVQECLNNAFRHAGARNQTIAQTTRDDGIVIRVCDGGPGFDPAKVRPGRLGLAGLRERIESHGGRLVIASSATGTMLEMWIASEELDPA